MTFSDCNNLISLKIPASVDSIGSDIIDKCKLLKELYIPASVKHIGSQKFNKDIRFIVDPANKSYYILKGKLHARTKRQEEMLYGFIAAPESETRQIKEFPGPVVKRYKIVNGKKVLISSKPYKGNSEKKKK